MLLTNTLPSQIPIKKFFDLIVDKNVPDIAMALLKFYERELNLPDSVIKSGSDKCQTNLKQVIGLMVIKDKKKHVRCPMTYKREC